MALGIDAYGLDVSTYALLNCEPEVVGRLHLGNALSLPFPDKSFQAVTSINTIHNLSRELCITAIAEMERIAPGRGFIQVDSYHTTEDKKLFEEWVLTAEYHDYPWEWEKIFSLAKYTGDWYWTIL